LIRIIFGEKGAGKTKRIINMANDSVQDSKGSLVFIDDGNQYMFDLKHEIRFIDASEFEIDGPKMFYGFLCGIAAQDFDLEYIFIDGFLEIVHHDLDTLEGLFDHLRTFSDKSGVKVVISINGDPEDIPSFIREYVVED